MHGFRLGFCGKKSRIHIGADIEPVCLPADLDAGDLPKLCHGRSFQTFCGDLHFPQQLTGQSPILLQQSHQQVHLLQLLMPILLGSFLCALDGLQRLLGIVIEIHNHSSFPF